MRQILSNLEGDSSGTSACHRPAGKTSFLGRQVGRMAPDAARSANVQYSHTANLPRGTSIVLLARRVTIFVRHCNNGGFGEHQPWTA